MLATKLESGGPVFYRQTRVGGDGEDFESAKLRSMVVGAENLGAGYAVDEGDARITRVGRVLRRTSIDELPQLWNVVEGHEHHRPAADSPLPGGAVRRGPWRRLDYDPD